MSAHERDSDVYFFGMQKAVRLLKYGKMKFDLITHEIDMEKMNEGFELIRKRPRGYIKAIMIP